jgi:Zn-dependent protease
MTKPYLPRAGIRPSPVFLLVVAIAALSGGYLWSIGAGSISRGDRAIALLFVIAVWVVSLCLHEFMHAFLAHRFGDREIEARGYLTLNPFKYTHPLLSIVLPVVFIALGGIGFPGGAVYVHTHLLRTRLQQALVSLSGPAVNVVSAVIALAVFRHFASSGHALFWYAVAFLALLQVSASVLNLLPVPGLDGYGTIEPYLRPETRRSMEMFKPFGMLAVFALLSVDQINRVFFDLVYWLFEVSGVNRGYASVGYDLVKFWST